MTITSLTDLIDHHPQAILFQCIGGSHAYGTAHENSDQDTRGVFMQPTRDFLALDSPIQLVSDKRNDTVYYTLHRFLQLASAANPNIIELLYMPADCIQKTTPTMQHIIDQRALLITQKIVDTHIGYANAQLKKARGQNKWINNPQPKNPPEKIDFCWLVSLKGADFPCRPVALRDIDITLTHCHVSSLEHVPLGYRLYHIGKTAKGIFQNNGIVCQSISKQQEKENFIGLLVFNKQGYDAALKDFQHYWHWRDHRNEHRWVNQERGLLDYDAKNMMHMFRLLLSAKSILSEGAPIVRFTDEPLTLLKAILAGNYDYDTLVAMAKDEIEVLASLKSHSDLPKIADKQAINALFYDLMQSQ